MHYTIAIIDTEAASVYRFRRYLITDLLSRDYNVIVLAPTDESFRSLSRIGAKCISVHFDRAGFNPIVELITIRNIHKELVSIKPDMVMCYTLKGSMNGSIAAYLAKVPKIYSTLTGLGHLYTYSGVRQIAKRSIVSFVCMLALRLNQKVFFQNRDDSSLFVRQRIVPRSKVVVVNGSGINIEEFHPIPKKSTNPVFLYMGRLLRTKGLYQFVDAAARVRSKYPDVEFRILGSPDSNPESVPKHVIEGWHRAGIIRYLGFSNDVRPHLGDCTAFVYPSYYREGIPRAVLEALAMGRPVITTDSPGCRETVKDEYNGYLVPVKDSNALAQAIFRLLDNPDGHIVMGLNSRKLAEDLYDVTNINTEIINTILA